MLNIVCAIIFLLVSNSLFSQNSSEKLFTGIIEYEERYYQGGESFAYLDSVEMDYVKEEEKDLPDDIKGYKPPDFQSLLPSADVFNSKTVVVLTSDSVTIIKTSLNNNKNAGIEEMYPKIKRKRNFPYKPILKENFSDSLVTIVINKNHRKQILGFECYQVIFTQLTNPMQAEFPDFPIEPKYVIFELWVTDVIDVGADIYYPDYKDYYYNVGFVMASKSTTNVPGVSATIEVTKILQD